MERQNTAKGDRMTKYLSETSKSFRYEKIQEALEKKVHELAEAYIGCHQGQDEAKLDDEAYTIACKVMMDKVEKIMEDRELYWIFDIMLQESFGHEPSQDNPYAIRKKPEPRLEAELTPMGIMFNIK